MNVVIDTNIWISALISKDGLSRDIIRLALNDKISPQISTTLFLEYETVMKREKNQQPRPKGAGYGSDLNLLVRRDSR